MAIALLPGDGAAVRSAAADITGTIPQLRTAHAAAVRVEEVLAGEHWRGEAFEAFRRVVERKPLPQALDQAVDRMGRAASELEWFASRFDHDQDQLRHLQAQAAALGAGGAGAGDDPAAAAALAAQLRALEEQAQAIHDGHRARLDQVADLFDWLDDETTFATPPPSTWDRVSGAVGDALDGLGDLAEGLWDVASSFGIGVYEGFRDLVVGVWELLQLLDPTGWDELWANRGQVLAVLRYAWENPVEFLGNLGSALLDLDTLFSDPARWLGRRVPDLLLALATGGAGTIGARAAGSVRGMRGVLGGVDDLSAVAAADRLSGADGIAGRYVRIGVDDAHLGQTGQGAFTRTDTVLGRIAAGGDGLGGAAQALRQGPGLVLDEVRAVTDLPVDAALRRLPDGLSLPPGAEAWVKRGFGNLVTNGFTGRLGMLDGMLVGYPALSPTSLATIAGVYGLGTLDSAADILGFGQAAMEAGTPVESR